MKKNLGLSVFVCLMALGALSLSGCGSSSAGNSSSTTTVATGTTGYTTCTTATTGQAQQCMPNLGTYGTTIIYQGMANITNVNVAGAFIHNIAPYQNDNIEASSLTNAWISLELQATESGPEINLTVQFPFAQDNMGVANVVFGGYDTFLPQNASETTDVGSILMQPAAINTTTSLQLTSFQDWDGQYSSMAGVSVYMNGVVVGSVGLTQEYSQE